MPRRWTAFAAGLALSVSALATAVPAEAHTDHQPDRGRGSEYTFAVIGDNE